MRSASAATGLEVGASHAVVCLFFQHFQPVAITARSGLGAVGFPRGSCQRRGTFHFTRWRAVFVFALNTGLEDERTLPPSLYI